MRDPLTLYAADPQSNDFSSLVPMSSLFQVPAPSSASLYDMSVGLQTWAPRSLHKDGGTWSPDTSKVLATTAEDQTFPKNQTKAPDATKEGKRVLRRSKKKYQRYEKPPYSYLAMITLVIQNSPDKMLKLSQILKHIEILFPFFKGDYIGWKDSVRHNLSSSDCFRKVLKDPGKPQAKGNFWTVDVTRIPLDAMKLQNTVMARKDSEMFVQDLSPFILQNYKYEAGGYMYQQTPGSNYSTASSSSLGDDSHQDTVVKLNTSFMIDSLLHDLQDVDLPDVSKSTESQRNSQAMSINMWSPSPLLYNHSNPHTFQSSRSGFSASQSLYSSSSSSLSTISPLSCNENPDQGQDVPGTPLLKSHISTKRPRPDEESSTCSDSDTDSCSPCGPPAKAPFLPCDLPTSYTKCVPPNVVAPHNVLPFFPFPRFTYYNYGHAPYMNPAYWGLLPQGTTPKPEQPCSSQTPTLDLDSMLRAVPPNKSVFDVLTSHPGDLVHPAFLSQYLTNSGTPCPAQSLL